MDWFWSKGPMCVKELQDLYPDPKPHFNTLSTQVRTLESNGYVGHKDLGSTFQYFASMSKREYGEMNIDNLVGKCFGMSYLNAVSTLVKEEKISIDELKGLIEQIESGK